MAARGWVQVGVLALTGLLGPDGIRVNAVAPGTIPTAKTEASWGSEAMDRLLRYSGLNRVGTPDDVADTVVSLCIDLSHVTGHVLVVDGGQLSHRPAAQ